MFRDETPESDVCTVCSREAVGNQVMKRELFSEKTIFLDDVDGENTSGIDTMKSIYVDTLDGEEQFEVKENMGIAVVAEVNDGISI